MKAKPVFTWLILSLWVASVHHFFCVVMDLGPSLPQIQYLTDQFQYSNNQFLIEELEGRYVSQSCPLVAQICHLHTVVLESVTWKVFRATWVPVLLESCLRRVGRAWGWENLTGKLRGIWEKEGLQCPHSHCHVGQYRNKCSGIHQERKTIKGSILQESGS